MLPGMKSSQVSPIQQQTGSPMSNFPPPPPVAAPGAGVVPSATPPTPPSMMGGMPAPPSMPQAAPQAAPAPQPTPQPAPQAAQPPAPPAAAVQPPAPPQAAVAQAAPTPPAPPAATEAPAPEQQLVTSAPRQVVAQSANQAVPEASGLSAIAAEDGFEGLEFDSYGVFPVVKLDQGEFQTSEGESFGQEFYCTMVRSRPKFLYRTDLPRESADNEVVYSYDNVTTTTGVPLATVFSAWREKGKQPAATPSRYLEVTATLNSDGRLILLSVPQQSIGNLSSYWAQLKFAQKDVRDTVTRVFRGKKVERVKNPFFPWAFEAAPNAS